MYQIRVAQPDQMDDVRGIFREYAASVSVDLCFQGFNQELAGLPGAYDPILLAFSDAGDFAGCVALRPLAPDIGEMKRLYVRPRHRGSGLGRSLIASIVEAARHRQFRALRLDTLPEMGDAIALYRRLGFREIGPYRSNPVPGALFLELEL